jgi:hypothetical protein
MEPGQRVAIWPPEKAAKLFLGRNEKNPVSRWVAIGEVVDRPNSPIGMGVDVTYVEERRPSTKGNVKRVRYGVKPGDASFAGTT